MVFYDNACNTFAAAFLRFPWIPLKFYIIVNIFHFKGHKWNFFIDADRYRSLANFMISAAEAINDVLQYRYIKWG